MKHNQLMFLLAVLVVLCFLSTAIFISYRNLWLVGLSLLAGFSLMGLGLKLKRNYQNRKYH
ncbi:DUF5325 family protein [Tenuibacillus multivorans]|uniref:Uncharacterized protein n=1 Tax=Tenuibacillus multivorans TaxID=237069 RepID=A0A1G9YB05_9BACI|nr:DUF5325 family protein [Tenuibacillus multivorans]GEL76023.1 hypothetical protein TMU01_02580 [Tenuibacillus multivorans]SDN06284.1 hypothetical protein SAMN05216498_1319 [Tenuibacillus multivorans]